MKNRLTNLVLGVLLVLSVGGGASAADRGTDALKYLPVQDLGRVKPFDTLARETLQLVYGSETFTTPKGEKRPAIEIVMTWMLLPQYWDQQKIMQINHKGLKDSLKLDENERYFSPVELLGNPRLSLILQELASYRATKQKQTPYFQAVQRLESQLGTYQAMKLGQAMRIVPPTPEQVTASNAAAQPSMGGGMMQGAAPPPEKWEAIADLKGETQQKFAVVIKALITALPNSDGTIQAPAAAGDGAAPSLDKAIDDFKAAARAVNPSLYPSDKEVSVEVMEKDLHPFKLTWILYLIAALTLAAAWHLSDSPSGKLIYRAGWFFAILAFGMHTFGFGLRCYIMGRPPVSNMYESVVWVSFGCMIFAMVLEAVYRRRFILMSGACVGILCLIIADLAPTILDKSLQPLEPVLRSNMWLTVHVLTIILSYSAYFLAWGLGNIGLGYVIRGLKPNDERIRAIVLSIYRAMQVGVVLLAAGIILGGIWADYSWGRFWGWDPKETWALIALLGYVAILHGRLVGWVKNIGMMISAVVAFNLVIMAWYGVNFVLGAGLHTYGMGAGGVQYVGGFVILNLIYVGFAAYVHKARVQPIAIKT